MRKVLTAVLILIAFPAIALAEDAAPAAEGASAPGEEKKSDAPTATAETSADASKEAKDGKPKKKVNVNATAEELQRRGGVTWFLSLDQWLGQGTFEGLEHPTNSEMLTDVGSFLSMGGIYGFRAAGVQLSGSASANVSFEYSTPDNATGRRFNWSDIRLGVSAPAIYKEKVTGIALTPSISATLPISLASRWQNAITSASTGVSLWRTFGPQLFVSMNLGAGKGFFAGGPGPTADQAREIRDQQQNQLFLCRADDVHCVGGLQAIYSLNTGLGATYRPTDKLSVSLGFGLSKMVMPWIGRDEFSSPKTDQDGNPVVKEQGDRDMMSGSLSVNYAFMPGMAASASVGTRQLPLNANNQGIRFPFYGLKGQERSPTSFSLGVSAQF